MIYTKVEVNQSVAHPSHFSPGNVRVQVTYRVRYLLRGFANNFELSHDSAGRPVVGLKSLQIHISHKRLNAVNGTQNVPQIKAKISHRMITSSRTASRNS